MCSTSNRSNVDCNLKFKEAVKSVLRKISEHNKVCKMSNCMIEIEPHSEEQ